MLSTLRKIKNGPAGMLIYRGITGVGALPYYIWQNMFPKTVVLLYHRVGTISVDPHKLTVSVNNFEAHLAYLKKNVTVISVSELYQALAVGHVPKRSVVITFDDGYEDNYTNAFPLLKKYGLPATIFVAGNGDPAEELWIDQLMQIITPTSVKYFETFKTLLSLSAVERSNRLQTLCREMNTRPVVRSDYRRLNTAQMREMIASGLITVGGHTVTHPRLSSLNPNEQAHEIGNNAAFIKSLGSQRIIPFAYPFGTFSDFNVDTIKIVKSLYPIAFTAKHGKMRIKTDIHLMPRFEIQDENLKKFISRLKKYQGWV